VTPLGVGLVGCGTISTVYLRNAAGFDSLRVVACSDADRAAAERTAVTHGLAACTTEELMRRDDVDIVLCLTPPDWHADVALQAIAAGKHVYTEKPLATSLDDGRRVIAEALEAGRLVGAAPDTFLGAGLETVHAALDGGAIGAPAVAETHLLAGPPEDWHPSPAFLYAERSGPLLDLGPYAITSAVALLGPVRRVTALATRPRETGTIESGPRAGTSFPIAEPTRVSRAGARVPPRMTPGVPPGLRVGEIAWPRRHTSRRYLAPWVAASRQRAPLRSPFAESSRAHR